MRLTTSTNLPLNVGERVGLRVGECMHGATVVAVDGDTVTLELVDSELWLHTGVHPDHPVRASQDAVAYPLPPGPPLTWSSSLLISDPPTVA